MDPAGFPEDLLRRPSPDIVDGAGTLGRMASDPTVTLSDGQVTLEPTARDKGVDPRALTWRALRLSTEAELGVIQLTPDTHAEDPIRARIAVTVSQGADTSTIHGLAQAVQLVCGWAFAAWKLSVISWLGPTEPALRAVMNEAGFHVHPFAHRGALDHPSGPKDAWFGDITPRDARDHSRRPLTAREYHVLTGMARGRSNHQIAVDLGISENTVKNHVRAILEVLQTPSRTAAVIEALRSGLVSMEFDPR